MGSRMSRTRTRRIGATSTLRPRPFSLPLTQKLILKTLVPVRVSRGGSLEGPPLVPCAGWGVFCSDKCVLTDVEFIRVSSADGVGSAMSSLVVQQLLTSGTPRLVRL